MQSGSRSETFVDSLSLLAAIGALVFHWYLVGLYDGFAVWGSAVSDYNYVPPEFRGTGMSVSDSDPYWALGNAMVPLTWCLLLFVVVRLFIVNHWIVHLSGLTILSISLGFAYALHSQIRGYAADMDPYLNGLRESIPFFWRFAGFLAAAWVLQLVSTVYALRTRYKN